MESSCCASHGARTPYTRAHEPCVHGRLLHTCRLKCLQTRWLTVSGIAFCTRFICANYFVSVASKYVGVFRRVWLCLGCVLDRHLVFIHPQSPTAFQRLQYAADHHSCLQPQPFSEIQSPVISARYSWRENTAILCSICGTYPRDVAAGFQGTAHVC